MRDATIVAGERIHDMHTFGGRSGDGESLWATLGFRRVDWAPGTTTVEWRATQAYGFVTPTGPVIQGGLVTAILDSAMGGACWTTLNNDEVFLTADLRVEFYRPTRPGPVRAVGYVERKTSKLVFCSAELFAPDGRVTAAARCTQVILAA